MNGLTKLFLKIILGIFLRNYMQLNLKINLIKLFIFLFLVALTNCGEDNDKKNKVGNNAGDFY